MGKWLIFFSWVKITVNIRDKFATYANTDSDYRSVTLHSMRTRGNGFE